MSNIYIKYEIYKSCTLQLVHFYILHGALALTTVYAGILGSESDVLLTYDSAMLPGMCVAPAPSEAQLEFKNMAGRDLKERIILFNWTAVGWCQRAYSAAKRR